MLVLGSEHPRVLLFLPGFLSPAGAYRELLEPVAERGVAQVRVPLFYRPGIPALLSHPSVQGEARAAAAMATGLAQRGLEVWLGGHSRGGQAAWLAAGLAPVGGLVLVDPVDGSGPRAGPTTTTRPAPFTVTPLIIGAGIGGPCAPRRLNHERFAAAAPSRTHVVVPGCGHADMLGGRVASAGRRLCGGGPDPAAARATVSALIAAFVAGELAAPAGMAQPLHGTDTIPTWLMVHLYSAQVGRSTPMVTASGLVRLGDDPGGPFDLVNGLPVHPLVVHAAVVLIPLTALGLLAMALSPRFSRGLGWLVSLGGAVAAGSAIIAKHSGESLEERVGEPGFDHAELGDIMPVFAAVLLLVTVVLWLVDRSAPAEGPTQRRGLRIGVALLASLVAAGNLVWIYRVGHSGAESVWSGRVAASPSDADAGEARDPIDDPGDDPADDPADDPGEQ